VAGEFKKGKIIPGQGKRGPGKATIAAREAIGRFVDGNANRLQGWLDKIADGAVDPLTGEVTIQPNPQKAFELFQTVIEYHVPKLARQEVVGDKDKPVAIEFSWQKPEL
jgi:hypothetical protein